MDPLNLQNYAINPVLKSMKRLELPTYKFLVHEMRKHLRHYSISLPLNKDLEMETEEQTIAREATLQDFVELCLSDDKLPPDISKEYFNMHILTMFLYAAWFVNLSAEDAPQSNSQSLEELSDSDMEILSDSDVKALDNPLVLQVQRAAQDHLGSIGRKRKFEAPLPSSRKKPRPETTFVGFTPEKVLDYLLSTLKEYHSSRYGGLFKAKGIELKELILSGLSDQLQSMFSDGIPVDHDGLRNLDQVTMTDRPVIYMHLINQYRYVGQARDGGRRIVSQHRSKIYRARNPCLHYSVWDSLTSPEELWVVLAYVPIFEVEPVCRGLLLNVYEMLGSLLFQTLTTDALDIYLVPDIARQTVTTGLNVALPIHQPQLAAESEVGAPVHELKLSSDTLVLQYYADVKQRATEASRKTRLSQAHLELITGFRRRLTLSNNAAKHVVAFVHVREILLQFYPKQMRMLNIEYGDSVTIKCEVSWLVAHEHAYATDALNGEAARRLAISCTTDAGLSVYWHDGGDTKAQMANSLVDELEGVPIEESRKRDRRWFRSHSKRKNKS
ncbi:MAG: hypothetical protein Q9219_001778 [cf. Caloplaca sp. 3 TL-2023]